MLVGSFRNLSLLRLLSLLSLLFSITLVGCGGGGSSDSNEDATSSSPDTTHNTPVVDIESSSIKTVTLTGKAIKGVIKNGLISVYGLENAEFSKLLSSGTTNSQGQFSLKIAASYHGPVKLSVAANDDESNPSLMVCDAVDGCGYFETESDAESDTDTSLDVDGNGRIDFGEDFILDADFTLNCVMPNLSQLADIGITSLTHMATAYVESMEISEESILAANSQVAKLFGLEGDLLSLKVTDLTDTTNLKNLASKDLNYSMISASVAALADHAQLGQVLNDLALDFVALQSELLQNNITDADNSTVGDSESSEAENDAENDTALIVASESSSADESSDTSLDDMVDQAAELAQELDLETHDTDQEQSLVGKLQGAEASDDEENNQDEEPTNTSDLEKVKALVADMQAWQKIFELDGPAELMAPYTGYSQKLMPEMLAMKNTLAQVGAWGLLPVLPELSITTMCNKLQPAFVAKLCNSLISADKIESICVTGSGMTIFGKDICAFFEAITLVKTEDLSVIYYFFDSKVTVEGLVDEHQVAFTMSTNTIEGDAVAFNMTGSISNDNVSFTIDQGTVGFDFAESIDLLHPKLPDSARLDFVGHIEQLNSETGETITYEGNLAATVDLTKMPKQLGKKQTLAEGTAAALSSGELVFEVTLQGVVSSSDGNSFASELILKGGATSTFLLSVAFDEDAMSGATQMEIVGTIEDQQMALLAGKFSLEDREFNITSHEDNVQLYDISNKDNVLMTLDLSANASGVIGTAEINGRQLGTIRFEDYNYAITYSDETSDVL